MTADRTSTDAGAAERSDDWVKEAQRVRRARRMGRSLTVWSVRLLVAIGLLGAWEAASGPVFNPFWYSAPSAIGAKLFEWGVTGELWRHLWITLQETVAGFFLGAAFGITAGIFLGLVPFLAKVFDPLVLALYSLPKVALMPLLIIWFGLGMEPKIVLAAILVFFLVFFNTLNGVRGVDQQLADVVRVMGASRAQMLAKIILPSALVWIFVGLRISIPYAMVGAVTGEIMASNQGIGYLIAGSAAYFDTSGVFAGLLALMIMSVLLNELLQQLENRQVGWRVG